MTIRELYEAVAKLGFQDNLEDTAAFFAAANRALLQINSIKPKIGISEVFANVPENLAVRAHYGIDIHKGGESLVYEATRACRSWCFEVLGQGSCKVESKDGDEWGTIKTINFSNTAFEVHRGLVNEEDKEAEIRLVFVGEYTYRVRGVAFYGEIYSKDEKDIPTYSKLLRVDLNEICPGFIELADNPLYDDFERLVDGYQIEGRGVILVPREAASALKIKYKRAPERLIYRETVTEDESEIDLDAELAELMPILTAVYIWLDEGDEKAGTYLQLYRERRAEIELKVRSREPVPMRFNSF